VTFLHPAMLAFSAAAAAPWVVHLLNRGRTRSVPWGAMMFLAAESSTGDYRSRLRSWGLLLLRSLIVITAAVALARPVVPPGGAGGWHWPTAGLRVGGPPTVVILLDTSPAMTYTVNNRSRFDQARGVALQLLSNLDPASRVGLVTSVGSADTIPPAADFTAVSAKLVALHPGSGDDDLAAALDRAAKLIDAAGESDDRRIYVVCDHHAAAWRNANDAFGSRWRDRHHPAVVMIPVGGEEADNVAVDSVRIVDAPVIRDMPATVEVVLRNLGPDAQPAVALSVFAGKTLADTVVQLPAKSQKAVRLTVKFNEPGSKVLAAAITSTGLTVDDRADTAIDVIESLRVLHVTATGATGGPISLALAPYTAAGRRGPGDATVTDATNDKWPATGLVGTDVVVIDGGVTLSPPHAGEIEQFVLDGGGLLLTAGPSAPAIDPALWRLVSSTPVGPIVTTPTRLTSVERTSKTWHFLGDRSVTDIAFPYRLTLPNLPGDARVIAHFDGNAPAMVWFETGRGHVLAVAGPLNDPEDDFIRSPIFLPWAQSAVHTLASGKVVDRNLTPSRPIEERVAGQVEERGATVQLMPAGKREPATVSHFEDGSEIRFAHTQVLGNYRLRYRIGGKELMENYVVSQPGAAVDLTPMTDAAWKSLQTRAGFEKSDATPQAVAAAAARSGASREVWIEFLALVAVLVVAESVLAGRVFS
jgi:hypothetical protein